MRKVLFNKHAPFPAVLEWLTETFVSAPGLSSRCAGIYCHIFLSQTAPTHGATLSVLEGLV